MKYLNDEKLIEVIDEYRDKSLLEEKKFAIMIDGEWGSGKTYFIDKYRNNKLDKKIIYISLFGVKTLEKLEDKIIYEQIVSEYEGKKGVVINGIRKTTDATLKIISSLFKDDDVKKLVKDIPLESIINTLSKPEGYFIILDDFERCEIEINELLGYIDVLLKKNGCLIVGSENDFCNSRDCQIIEKYNKTKEKIISNIYYYNPDIEVALSNIIKNSNISSITQKILEENCKELVTVFNKTGCKNIRTLKFIINEYNRLINKIDFSQLEEKEIQLLEMLLLDVLKYLTYKAICLKKGIVYTNNYEYDDEVDEHIKNEYGLLINAYKVIDEALESGYYDKQRINDFIKKYIQRLINRDELDKNPLNVLKYWWENEETKVLENLNIIKKMILKGELKEKYFTILKKIIKLEEAGYKKDIIDDFIETMSNAIDEKVEFPSVFEDDNEFLKVEKYINKYKDIKNEFVDKIKAKQSQSVIENLNDLLKNEDSFLPVYKCYFKYIDSLGEENILNLLDIEILIKKIDSYSVLEFSNYRRAMYEIYRKSIEGRAEIKEISQIKRLFEYYSNKMDNYIITDVSLRYNMKLYLDELNTVIENSKS